MAANTDNPDWARQESIQQGAWSRYQPRPVKIIVDAFMEKDTEGNSHWFVLEKNQFVQGLIATDGPFSRLYVVTEDNEHSCHKKRRWPRILNASDDIRKPQSLF